MKGATDSLQKTDSYDQDYGVLVFVVKFDKEI